MSLVFVSLVPHYCGTESPGKESFVYEWKKELNNLCIRALNGSPSAVAATNSLYFSTDFNEQHGNLGSEKTADFTASWHRVTSSVLRGLGNMCFCSHFRFYPFHYVNMLSCT
ncbi:uncharacterized protein V6R79_012866 [Siganus canaliculatus]